MTKQLILVFSADHASLPRFLLFSVSLLQFAVCRPFPSFGPALPHPFTHYRRSKSSSRTPSLLLLLASPFSSPRRAGWVREATALTHADEAGLR